MTNSQDDKYFGRSNASIAVSKAREKKCHAQGSGLYIQRGGPTVPVGSLREKLLTRGRFDTSLFLLAA